MKKTILLLLAMLAILTSSAQDVLITQKGDIMNVYEIEVGGTSVFYKNSPNDNGSQKISKEEVLMIKYKDGRVEKFDSSSTSNTLSSSLSSSSNSVISAGNGSLQQMQLASENNSNWEKDNLLLVKEFNSHDVKYIGATGKTPHQLVVTLGLKEGSIIETPDLRASFVMKRFQIHTGAFGRIKEQGIYDLNESMTNADGPGDYMIEISLRNKSNRTIFVDLANSFVINGDNATPYYVPSATSTISESSRGGSVGLGAVTGALGIGGKIGQVASGVTVGGSTSKGSSTTTFAQRIVSIPPSSSITLEPKDIGEELIKKHFLPFSIEKGLCEEEKKSYDINFFHAIHGRGEKMDIPEPETSCPLAIFITYAYDETMSSVLSMRMDFYVRQVLGANMDLSFNKSYGIDLRDIDYSQCPLIFFTSPFWIISK